MRAAIVRSKFAIQYDLPGEITFKVADTEGEIEQAMRLVHDSYVELGYIDPTESKLRFSKHHAHPNAVILVVKWLEDVIGTLTLIPDSALGLPSDQTWPLDEFRERGKILAEVSSLAIKKDFRMRRGQLLLPLCKYMYQISTEHLGLDGVIAATTSEVAPFYSDLLLFEPIGCTRGVRHDLVKGNPSFCGILNFDDETEKRAKKIFGHLPDERNIFKFMKETTTPNFRFPKGKLSIQTYSIEKNAALSRILDRNPSLLLGLDELERHILKSYDIGGALGKHFTSTSFVRIEKRRDWMRPEVRRPAICFATPGESPLQCKIVDLSSTGLGIKFQDSARRFAKGEIVRVRFEHEKEVYDLKAQVRWTKANTTVGVRILESPEGWETLVEKVIEEITEEIRSSAA